MAKRLINTDDIERAKVWMEKPRKNDPDATKKMGRVRACVFHPSDKRCVGFIVKRPDLALMFHRKDLFVAYNGYDVVDGNIVVRDDPTATDKGACKALGINWDDCVLWVGLPVMSEDGESYGIVGNVTFNRLTGTVDCFETDNGATSNALLGKRTIPADMVRGFKRGMGAALANMGAEGMEGEEVQLGAMLVSPQVANLNSEGGVAEKAGAATAVAVDKVQTTVDKAKPVVSKAAAATGEAVNKGAYATGKQISKSKHMFQDFKAEYDKAVAPSDGQKKAASASKAPSSSKTSSAKKKAAPKKKNMFAAFKDEYDKARNGD